MVIGFLSLPVLLAIAVGGAFAVGFIYRWLVRDRRSHSVVGHVVYSTDVHVKVRRRPRGQYNFIGTPSGCIRLVIGEDTVAIRGRLPVWVQQLAGGGFTLDAASFEVDRAKIGRVLSLPDRGDEYVVLRGTDKHGWLEIGFRPRTATLDDLQRELVRAGAHPLPRS